MKRRVQIHWSFIALALAMIILGHAGAFLMFLISVSLHELAHIFAVKIFGGRVKNLRLMALGEIATVDGLEKMSAGRRYIVFFSGPFLSVAIGAVSFLFGFSNLAAFNFLVGFFNLIPVFPLDGGRAAQLFLGNRLGILRGNRMLTRFGRIIGWLIIIIGIAYAALYPCDVSLVCVGIYIRQWNRRALIPLTAEFFNTIGDKMKIKKGVIPIRLYTVSSDLPIRDLIERISWDKITHAFIDGHPENLLRENDLIIYVLENGLSGTLGAVLDIGIT